MNEKTQQLGFELDETKTVERMQGVHSSWGDGAILCIPSFGSIDCLSSARYYVGEGSRPSECYQAWLVKLGASVHKMQRVVKRGADESL